MADPLSQIEIEQEIMRLCGLLEKVTHEIGQRARAAAEADAKFKRAWASAYLMTEGTVGMRESLTAMETDTEYTQRRTTEALLLSAKSAGENFRTQISALQTLASNHRALVSN